MSETYPTRAKDRSWLGYDTGPRYTISAVNKASSTLIATVAAVHIVEQGLGSPDSKVHATRGLLSLSRIASFSLPLGSADLSKILRLFPLLALVAGVQVESCLAGSGSAEG